MNAFQKFATAATVVAATAVGAANVANAQARDNPVVIPPSTDVPAGCGTSCGGTPKGNITKNFNIKNGPAFSLGLNIAPTIVVPHAHLSDTPFSCEDASVDAVIGWVGPFGLGKVNAQGTKRPCGPAPRQPRRAAGCQDPVKIAGVWQCRP